MIQQDFLPRDVEYQALRRFLKQVERAETGTLTENMASALAEELTPRQQQQFASECVHGQPHHRTGTAPPAPVPALRRPGADGDVGAVKKQDLRFCVGYGRMTTSFYHFLMPE